MDGWERPLVAMITTAVTVYVISLIVNGVRAEASRVGHQRVLEYGPGPKRIALVGWVGFAIVMGVLLFSPTADWELILWTVVLLGLPVLVLNLEFYGVRISYDAEGIQTRSAWRWPRKIPWSEVQQVWYSRPFQWYVIQTTSGGRIRLHDYLDGADSLIGELRKRGVPVKRKRST